MIIVVSPEAKNDLDEAAFWYENKSKGLGFRFLNEIKSTLSYIRANPISSPLLYASIRVCVVKTFPYSIHYKYF